VKINMREVVANLHCAKISTSKVVKHD